MNGIKHSFKIFLVFAAVTITAQTGKEISVQHLKSNLEFLADDLLEGREAGSHGEKIASLFISKELAKYGVKPFGDRGSYFQDFPMRLTGIDPDASIVLENDNKIDSLRLGDHFIYSKWNNPAAEYSGLTGDIIFAGYGISAPEYDYDDYNNLDVKGKTVLVFDDMPVGEDDTVFSNNSSRLYGFWSTKGNTAQEHGAAAVLIIPSQNVLDNWNYYSNVIVKPGYSLYDSTETGINDFNSIPVAGLNYKGLELLLKNEKLSAEELISYAGSVKLPESLIINKSASFNYSYYNRIETGRNVIGLLEGTDEELKDEYIAISAHYDHLGVVGTSIFNGADDNGSGTVGVLETARLLASENMNKRSVVFLFYTAEEKGLLGSEYLTSNVDWINSAIANINIDMIGRKSADSIYCIGSDKLSTEFYELVETVNDEGDYFTLDYRFNADDDPNRYYWRSDHVHFAEKGIPVVFFYDYMKTDYHKPTDTFDKINFEKIYKIVNLVKDITLKVANMDHKLIVDKNFTR